MRTVDVLVVNEHEARHLSGHDEATEAARSLLSTSGSVVVTLGEDGALAADADGVRHVPGVSADVVDTTGAGDTFTGVSRGRSGGGGRARRRRGPRRGRGRPRGREPRRGALHPERRGGRATGSRPEVPVDPGGGTTRPVRRATDRPADARAAGTGRRPVRPRRGQDPGRPRGPGRPARVARGAAAMASRGAAAHRLRRRAVRRPGHRLGRHLLERRHGVALGRSAAGLGARAVRRRSACWRRTPTSAAWTRSCCGTRTR